MVLHLPDSWSNWNLEMLVSWEEWKTQVPREKPLRAKERTNNKLNPRMMGDTDRRQVFSALHHPAPPSLPLHFAYMFENLKKYISIAQTWESFRKYPSVGKVTLSLLSITTVCWKKCKQMIVVVVVVLSKWLVQNIKQDKCNSLRISKWLVQS